MAGSPVPSGLRQSGVPDCAGWRRVSGCEAFAFIGVSTVVRSSWAVEDVVYGAGRVGP